MSYLEKKTGYIDTEKLLAALVDSGLDPETASDVSVQVGLARSTITWSQPRKVAPQPEPEVTPDPPPAPPTPPEDPEAWKSQPITSVGPSVLASLATADPPVTNLGEAAAHSDLATISGVGDPSKAAILAEIEAAKS